uniref:Uncharacterized protein YydD, contains DUF2326 domain n=1 Tax=Candidatus Kentrum sp. TC TaxID=2126339 RepID=A0A450Z0N6_9GAMM|nr:MAG: Uncharacterized protein YydD, contains DUF2326 domain [Candidatus Kentron sp. TC]VFK57089.1 MAG: Uncharacterized protein YydD, contains DUF2326 domain [Candidatus Kentron sp. TC]
MFLKSLTVSRGDGAVVRDVRFHTGLNLIVDETPGASGKKTGNNVGKTTVLKLVDFCLGAKAREIYIDPENKRNEYGLVKNFLVDNRVLVSLVLKDDLSEETSREVRIKRNFLARKEKIQRIDGDDKTEDQFKEALTDLLFPGHRGKPTFRQIIAHNIRYKDASINNTLKHLDHYARDDEYETLYLFLFGCDFDQGDAKQKLRSEIGIEEGFKKRIESEWTKFQYEAALNVLQSEIEGLERRKASLGLNPNFEADLDRLNETKYRINLVSAEIGRLELRRKLILEAQKEIQAGKSEIDLRQLRQIYQQATSMVSGIQRTFEELHDFHNKMVTSKVRFITKDLPGIDEQLRARRGDLRRLQDREIELTSAITRTDSFDMLEELIAELNSKYQTKGEYENTLGLLRSVDAKLAELGDALAKIDDELFSEAFALQIKRQIDKFNRHFSSVSNELYGERYALTFKEKTVKGRRLYEFRTFDLNNFSSGKKQGEISCFDIAYTLFAEEENIPCMHFLLNDKKELMHGNQLAKIANLVDAKGIQFVASILRDKLPEELNREEYVILKLSQDDKFFRIERGVQA